MNYVFEPKELKRMPEARNSFSGLMLTDRQFDEVIAYVGVLSRYMQETGKFQKKLDDCSSCLATSENFNSAKANTIIRDIYRIVNGETMKQTLDRLLKKEKALFDRESNPAEAERNQAYRAANDIGLMVQEGNKMTFNRAFAHRASELATNLGITDAGAKKFIRETFKETENREFRDWGKELDDKYYRPQVEAEKRQRQAEKSQTRKPQHSYS